MRAKQGVAAKRDFLSPYNRVILGAHLLLKPVILSVTVFYLTYKSGTLVTSSLDTATQATKPRPVLILTLPSSCVVPIKEKYVFVLNGDRSSYNWYEYADGATTEYGALPFL